MLQLNETQSGVLNILFRIAEEGGQDLLKLRDLRAMAQYVGDHAQDYTKKYGNISTASIGAIQRSLLALESQGGDKLFGEPALNLDDFIQTDTSGHARTTATIDRKLTCGRLVRTGRGSGVGLRTAKHHVASDRPSRRTRPWHS